MTVAGVIWSLNLLVQAYVVWLVFIELRAPYQFPRWRWKWGLMGVAASLMLVRRLYNVLWLHVDLPWLDLNRTQLEVYIPFLITIFLALSLRQARKIYSPIAPLALAPPAIIVMDAASVVVQWNTQATRLFGWTEAEAVGQPLPPLIIPEDLRAAHYAGVARFLAQPAEAQHLKSQYFPLARDKRGQEFQVEVTMTALPQPDGTLHFLGSVRKLIAV